MKKNLTAIIFVAFLSLFTSFSAEAHKIDAGLTSVQSPSGTICAGRQSVQVSLKNFGSDTLKSDSIYWAVNGIVQSGIKWNGSLDPDSSVTVTINNYLFLPGNNTILAWSAKPNGVIDSAASNDTAKTTIKVKGVIANAGGPQEICSPGNAIIIGPSIVYASCVYSWKSVPSGFTSSLSNPVVSPTTSTKYILTIKDTVAACTSPADTMQVTIGTSMPTPYATYFGGSGYNIGQTIVRDKFGNTYISGSTESTSGVATKGAFQTSLAGFRDAFLAKFNCSGELEWSTYYGEGPQTVAYGMTVDDTGNIYLIGEPGSVFGFDVFVTSGAYQTSPSSTFIAKFNSSGMREWGTYYGGNKGDEGTGITTDKYGNVYITGTAFSKSGVASSGAYQTSLMGSQNAFLAKFNSKGSRIWATYYGGTNQETGKGVATDSIGNIYIVGHTDSDTLIATKSAYQTSYADSGDAYLAKFDSSGSRIWATYYGGSNSDGGNGVAIHGTDVYITGSTLSRNGIATKGTYQTSFAGGGAEIYEGDAFLAKFDTSGSFRWGTYYGGSKDELCNSIAIDGSGSIYIGGLTFSTSGIATKGAYQTALNSGISGSSFLAKFNSKGANEYGTYFGDTSQLFSISTDNIGNAYIVGYAHTILTTSGAYQTSRYSTSANTFFAKLNLKFYNDAGLSPLPSSALSVCSGTQPVKVQLVNYGNNTLTSVKIGWEINGKAQTTFNWTGSLKTDSSATVTLGIYNFSSGTAAILALTGQPNGATDSLPENDTARETIKIYSQPSANTGTSKAICLGMSDSIGATAVSGDTYSWASNPSGFASTVSNPSASPTTSTTYYLNESITGTSCSNSDSVVITVNPLPKAGVGSSKTICQGSSISIGNAPVNGNKYSWSSNPAGFYDTSSQPKISPWVTTTYYLTETNISTGCYKADSVVIKVTPMAIPAITGSPYICINSPSWYYITNYKKTGKYVWSLTRGGKITGGNGSDSILAEWDSLGHVLVGATETDTPGCYGGAYFDVQVKDIPNASFSQSITNTSVRFSPADSTLTSYRWLFGDGDSSVSVKPTHNYSAAGTYKIQLTAKNSNGCSQTDSANIVIKTIGVNFTVNDTNCTHTSISFFDSSISNGCGTINNWLWSFGDGNSSSSQNPSHTYTTAGVFAVKLVVSSSGGCSDSIIKNIFVDSTCVWPGDANDNKLVEITDMLNIGIAYGDSGAKRSSPVTTWEGQYCDNWGKKFLTGADYKHADCNGDGVVDSSDLLAFGINWSDSHLKTGPDNTGNPANPPFYLSFSKTSYHPGDTVTAAIMLGAATNALTNVYGLASSLAFDLAYVDTNTLKIDFMKSWFGNPGTDMFYFLHPEYKSGVLYFGISRTDHKNTSGNGEIGNISFVIPSKASVTNSVSFIKGATKLIAFNETVLPVYTPGDSFSVQTPTGIKEPNSLGSLHVSPNPFTTTLSISYTLPQPQNVQLTITDITGKQVAYLANENQNAGQHICTFDADKYNVPAGIYFLKMIAGNDMVEEKIVRIK